ncbi:MAG: hypothetical protein WCD70_03340 [Alphaproteobacteria bacterium]
MMNNMKRNWRCAAALIGTLALTGTALAADFAPIVSPQNPATTEPFPNFNTIAAQLLGSTAPTNKTSTQKDVLQACLSADFDSRVKVGVQIEKSGRVDFVGIIGPNFGTVSILPNGIAEGAQGHFNLANKQYVANKTVANDVSNPSAESVIKSVRSCMQQAGMKSTP